MPAQGSHRVGFLAALAWVGVESWVILRFLVFCRSKDFKSTQLCYKFNSYINNKYLIQAGNSNKNWYLPSFNLIHLNLNIETLKSSSASINKNI
jgi:hypothetical protein